MGFVTFKKQNQAFFPRIYVVEKYIYEKSGLMWLLHGALSLVSRV